MGEAPDLNESHFNCQGPVMLFLRKSNLDQWVESLGAISDLVGYSYQDL